MMQRSALDLALGSGSTVADALFRPIEAAGCEPVIVDVGARNGFYLLPPAYTRRSRIVGFEPNPIEFEKLTAGTTDAEQLFGWSTPFKAVEFKPWALWRESGSFDFFITKGAGACTMKGPTLPISDEIYYHYPNGDPRRQISFRDLHTEVLETVPVECRTLDEVIDSDTTVDFLKLDVEGGEADVLAGAKRLIGDGRVLALRCEFQTAPYYHGHALLHDQHRILHEAGYRLIDLELNHPRYRQGRFDLKAESDRGLVLAGDATYVKDPNRHDLSASEAQRLGILAIALWYSSFGLFLVERAALCDGEEIERIYGVIKRASMHTWKGRLVRRWMDTPYAVARSIQRARRLFRLP